MYTFLSVVYVLVCSFLIMVVLLQQGRGGGMGSLGGGSQTVFGGSGAGNVLTRLTTASAALFMILSATLAWMSSSGDSALEDAIHQREAANREGLHEALEGEHGEGGDDEGTSEQHHDEGTSEHHDEGSTTTPVHIDLGSTPEGATTAPVEVDLGATGEAHLPVHVDVPASDVPAAPAAPPATDAPAPPPSTDTAAH